jgi:hypothetical protein
MSSNGAFIEVYDAPILGMANHNLAAIQIENILNEPP